MTKKEIDKCKKLDKLTWKILKVLLAIPPVVIIIMAIGVVIWGYYVGYPEYVGKYSNPLPFFGYVWGEIEDKVGGVCMFFIVALAVAFMLFCFIVDGKKILETWLLIGVGYVGYRVAKKALKVVSNVTSSSGVREALVVGVAAGVAGSYVVKKLKEK